MRYAFTLIIAFYFAQLSFAQPGTLSSPAHKVQNNVVGQLLRYNQQRLHNVAAKTTVGVITQRVIAQSTRDNGTGTYTDSVMCNYTGMHGSAFDYNHIIYPYNYPYGTTPMFEYAGIFTEPQVVFDTYVHWTINPFIMPTFMLYEGCFATYDTNSNLTHFTKLFVDSTINDNVSYRNAFDTLGNIATGLTFNLNAGVEDSAFKQYFAYDTASRLVKDSVYELHLGVWRIAARTMYTYDVSGNLIKIDHFANTLDTSFLLPLVQQSQYINGYDASGRLTSVATSLFDGTALGPYVKDTFGYTGTSTFHTSWRQHQFDEIHGTWWPQYNMTKHLNSIGKPDTVYHQGWDSIANSWKPISKDAITYNTYNNPAKVYNYEYNWTAYSPTPDYTTTYYYDTFTLEVPSNVKQIVREEISIFPNPANDIMKIDIKNGGTGGYTVSVSDVAGRVLSRQSLSTGGSKTVSIRDLSPGMYILSLYDRTGNVLVRNRFIKE